MKRYFIIFLYLIVSCTQEDSKKGNNINKNSIVAKEDKDLKTFELERDPVFIEKQPNQEQEHFETRSPEKYHYYLPERELQITIVKSYLDTYMTINHPNGYSTQSKESQFNLNIKYKTQVLLDTVFIKEDFYRYINKEELENLTLDRYNFLNFGKTDPYILKFIVEMAPSYPHAQHIFFHQFDLRDRKMRFYVQQGEVLINIPEKAEVFNVQKP